MKDEFYFPSKDGNTEIHTIVWKPEGEIRAVLQLAHGMVEYIDRYDEFAAYLCERGIYVVGNDHLGHGKSVQSKAEYGYFHKKNGNACLLADMHTFSTRISKNIRMCRISCWDIVWDPFSCVSIYRFMEMDWRELFYWE